MAHNFWPQIKFLKKNLKMIKSNIYQDNLVAKYVPNNKTQWTFTTQNAPQREKLYERLIGLIKVYFKKFF